MGQSKQRKERLGIWYGHPIEPGHPDFAPPKKPEPKPTRQVDRVVDTHVADAGGILPEATYLLTNQTDPSQNGVYTADEQGNLRRAEPIQEESMHVEATKARTGIDGCTGRAPVQRNRRYPGLVFASLLGIVLASGIDLGPEPEHRPKKR